MTNKILYTTVLSCFVAAVPIILITYFILTGHGPSAHIDYALLVAALPALGTLIVVKLTSLFTHWYSVVIVYFALFAMLLLLPLVQAL